MSSAKGAGGIGELLRGARERAGLSPRELATLMGASWVTVREAEADRDLRHSTLARYLQALPSLTAADLVAREKPQQVASHLAAWRHYRDLFGFEAAQQSRTCSYTARGACTHDTTIEGLRSLRADMRELSVILGLHRNVYNGSEAVLTRMEAEVADVTMRVVERTERGASYQLRIPRHVARSGLTLRDVRRRSTRSIMTAKQAARHFGPTDGDYSKGVGLAPTFPVRRLLLSVKHPPGYQPQRPRVVVWPAGEQPNPELEGISSPLLPALPTLRHDVDSNTLSMEVDHPLIGLSYNIAWVVP